MRYVAALLLGAMFAPAAYAQTAPAPEAKPVQDPRDAKVSEAIAAINKKDAAGAIAILDPVLASFDEQYPSKGPIAFCAEDTTDMLIKLAAISTLKKDGVALSDTWCYALWAKGFALIELGRIADAVAPLERAVEMMPSKAEFQSELGYVHQALKHFDRSLAAYTAAAEAARRIKETKGRNFELRRAWFGMAYAEIEFGRLDKAENLLNRALEVAPGDQKILNELDYIRQQKGKKPG